VAAIPLPNRDARETALEAGLFLKERQPDSEVVVRDVRNDVQTVIGWKNGKASALRLRPRLARVPVRTDPAPDGCLR
jgi:hypothetical protein